MSRAHGKTDARLKLLTASVQFREAVYCGQHAAVFEESVHNCLQSISEGYNAQSPRTVIKREIYRMG